MTDSTSLNKFADNEVELRRVAIAYGCSCRIVNLDATADGCVDTADTTQLGRINSQHCSVSQIFDQIRRQSSEQDNSTHTARRLKTSMRLNSTVASRRRRRCVLGIYPAAQRSITLTRSNIIWATIKRK